MKIYQGHSFCQSGSECENTNCLLKLKESDIEKARVSSLPISMRDLKHEGCGHVDPTTIYGAA